MSLKWENYFLRKGVSCVDFWDSYIKEGKRDILFLLAIGFDPRTSAGLETIYTFDSKIGKRDVIGIRYYTTERKDDPSDSAVMNHVSLIESFLEERGLPMPTYKDLVMRSASDISSASANAAADIISGLEEIEPYTDIVVDISAMPRSVFIALVNKLLILVEHHNAKNIGVINLHLLTTENSHLDSKIIEQGIEETPSYIQGFALIEKARTSDFRKVWIPILGENQRDQFVKIRDQIQPDEICPILPFPSMDLRRGDELINYYQDVLLSDPAFSLANIIYADELNPFHTYRLLVDAITRYKTSFDLLRGCKIYLSTLSSKLLSIGTFLAAYEIKSKGLEVGILHVESRGHKLKDEITREGIKEIAEKNNLFEIWLAGEAYNKN
ncbi:MAG: hypothetical protein QM731_28540 [Chitinophagaceae bacterium]